MATQDEYKKALQVVTDYQNEYNDKLTPAFICACCKQKEIKRLDGFLSPTENDPLDKIMWNGGSVQLMTFGYGSRHDNMSVYVAICDDCIHSLCDSNIALYHSVFYRKIRKQLLQDNAQ